MTPGDLDDDGDLDLAVSGTAAFEHVVLLNQGAGAFTSQAYESFVMQLRAFDVDGDDDLDLVGVGGGGGIRGSAVVQHNAGDGTFGAVEEFVTGNNPLDIEVADLQGDGRPDLLVAARDIATGVVHLQRPDGSFGAPDSGQLFSPSVDVATADVDGDGAVDVAAAVTDFAGGNDIQLQLNDGTGDLSPGQTIDAGGTGPRALVAGDLDGDDDADLAWLVGQGQFGRVATALGNGNGTFSAPVLRQVPTCSDNLELGDADDDGDLDQLVGNESFGCPDSEADDVSVSLNDGDGGFDTEPLLVPLTVFTSDVHAADIDGDGVADLVGGGSGQGGDDDIAVALGNGDGTFADPLFTSTGQSQREFVVRDLDRDGNLDLATLSFQEGAVILLGDGTGAFPTVRHLAGEEISGYRNAVGIAVGDVDADGIADIAVANETGSDVGVHSGFGDGTFDGHQVHYGMRPRVTDVELADLDNDGTLDIISPATLPNGGRVAGDGIGGRTAAAAQPPGLTLLLGSAPACTLRGTPADDVLRGTSRADVICGGDGDDVLVGLGSGDILRGGIGADELYGSRGLDVLTGGFGNDSVTGGEGNDLLRGGAGRDTLRGLGGGDVIDLLDGVRRNDIGDGGDGRDRCSGDRFDSLTACP